MISTITRDDRDLEIPVPIPNTEVKQIFADGTWWVTAWESRTLRVFLMFDFLYN